MEFTAYGKLITFEGGADGEGYGTFEGTDAPQELVETVGKAIVKNKGAKNGKSVNAKS